MTLESPAGTQLVDCQSAENPSASDAPENIDFPYGFFTFTLKNIGPGGSITATIFLPEGASPTTYYKYGPTPPEPAAHWYEFLSDGETGAVISGNKITLHFVDGKRGDSDFDDSNGTIADPGGPAINDSGGNIAPIPSGDGGGGGCFIGSVARE